MHAAFGRASVWGPRGTSRSLADEVDVRVIVLRGGGCTAVLAVADLVLIPPPLADRLCRAVAAALEIPVRNAGVFATQNRKEHVAPPDRRGPATNRTQEKVWRRRMA